ncbi:MAG: CHASE2 domain-containing protein [Cyclobacteriaceae bacterium]|nr:CHASE2 domain-containing protein [Cyclobacteriaceae bacterium]
MSRKKMEIGRVWLESIYATIFILLFMALLQEGTKHVNLEGFDAIGQALADLEITDYTFSELRDTVPPDTNIVIVNFGPLGRDGIAEQIRIIDKYNPKVIGVDSFFKGYGSDTLSTYSLASAITNANAEVVLVTRVEQSDSLKEKVEGDDEIYDLWYKSDSMFIQNVHFGMANLDTQAEFQEDIKICRAFPAQRSSITDGESYIAFGAKMAVLYDSTKLENYMKRTNEYEVINFRGDIFLSPFFYNEAYGTFVERRMEDKYMRYEALDWDQVLSEDFAPEMVEGKIVLFGYLGNQLGATQWEDKFFTPLNSKIAGRANPDMYGPVIHANIISMVLNNDYINGFNSYIEALIGIGLLYINVFFFSIIYIRMGAWYDGITKLIQIVEIIALTIFVILIFSTYNFKLELAIAFFGIALVGDLLEIYYGVIKNVVNKKTWNKLITLGVKKG